MLEQCPTSGFGDIFVLAKRSGIRYYLCLHSLLWLWLYESEKIVPSLRLWVFSICRHYTMTFRCRIVGLNRAGGSLLGLQVQLKGFEQRGQSPSFSDKVNPCSPLGFLSPAIVCTSLYISLYNISLYLYIILFLIYIYVYIVYRYFNI